MFYTKGVLTYEPKRNMKGESQWWLTIELPNFEEIARYYRWHIDRSWVDADSRPYKRPYLKPPHPPHVSVIRGEAPRANVSDWGTWNARKTIKVGYSNRVRQTTLERDGKDTFWFINAMIPEYPELRKHFGLDYQRDGVPFRGHITIARSNDEFWK